MSYGFRTSFARGPAQVIQLPERTHIHSQESLCPEGHSAQILLFTGVRYERHEERIEAPDDHHSGHSPNQRRKRG